MSFMRALLMAFAKTFTPDQIEAIRSYCEAQLRSDVAKMAVVERDMGACVGVIVELDDGYRLAVMAGNTGRDVGQQMVVDLRQRIARHLLAMH
jgi:hypothetical protein